MTARSRVTDALREIGLQSRPAPDIPDADWERWLAYFQEGYAPLEDRGRCSWCSGKLAKQLRWYGDFAGCSNCPITMSPMKKREKNGDTWYSHRLTGRSWCKGAGGDQPGDVAPKLYALPYTECRRIVPLSYFCLKCRRCRDHCTCEEPEWGCGSGCGRSTAIPAVEG